MNSTPPERPSSKTVERRSARGRLRRCALLAAIVVAVLGARDAVGQGLGGWISPGPLATPHADLEGLTQCGRCHSLGEGLAPELCLECHDSVAAQVDARRGYHADKGVTCERCHPDHRGREFEMVRLDEDHFSHDTTGYRLRGAHGDAACTDCHTEDGVWSGVDTSCVACHLDADPHRGDDSGRAVLADCQQCHTEVDWDALPLARSVFDHSQPSMADFATRGAHAEVACQRCHEEWRFVPLGANACTDCHRNPHRLIAQKGTQCTDCHGEWNWRVEPFDHALTEYALEGAHVDVACGECHGADISEPVEHGDCVACHDDFHDGHFAPEPCVVCHVPTSWLEVADFDHDRTSYPLDGAHAEVECEACHADGQWDGVLHQSCLDCHSDENPHSVDELPADGCLDCHIDTTWDEPSFDHDGETDFALAPPHDAAACLDCHSGHDHYRDLMTDCTSCHADDAPEDHFAGECSECHAGITWRDAGLGELGHEITGFSLHGAHATTTCASCHTVSAAFADASPWCIDCHATEDAHRHQLGDDCDDCHRPTTWLATTFRHSTTGWPVRGAHRLAECIDCHATGYGGTPRDCRPCHEYQATPSEPAHQSAWIDQCDSCHRTYTWLLPAGWSQGR